MMCIKVLHPCVCELALSNMVEVMELPREVAKLEITSEHYV